MLVTKDFVFVHLPKTGGTFVSHVLDRLAPTLETREATIQHPWIPFHKVKRKHGTCREIPRGLIHKQILSCVRNPYDLYVSDYEFGWWQRKESVRFFRRRISRFKKRFAGFPNLTFGEWLDSSMLRTAGIPLTGPSTPAEDWVGTHKGSSTSSRAIQRQRCSTIATIPSALNVKNWRLFDARFLRTAQLNQDLYQFLCEQGIPERRLTSSSR